MARAPKYPNDISDAAREVLDYRPPVYLSVIRRGLLAIAVLALISVAYTAYWFFVATKLKDGVEIWLAEQTGPAVQASFQRMEISGYPLSFRVIMLAPSLAATSLSASRSGDGWRWQGERAVAEMKPWNFNRFQVDLSGNHKVAVNTADRRVQYAGNAERVLIDTQLYTDGQPEFMTLDVGRLSIKGQRRGETVAAGQLEILARRLMPDPITNKTPTFSLKLKAENLTLPSFLGWPLGHDIAKLDSTIRLLGEIDDPRSLKNITKWRDDGGIIEIDSVDLKYGPLSMRANGTLALDNNFQPLGALSANFQGFFSTINRLRDARIIRSRDAAMAKVVLGVLSKRSPGGGPATLSLPLSIRDGKLTAQQMNLMTVPPIKWPDAWKEKDGFKRLR